MCGIAGAFVFKGSDFIITESYIAAMRDTLAHRGPDGVDTWISNDKKVGIGHRRLAIIDLSTTADQPMSNEDGSLWIIFNGEIYNHAAVRAELENIGGHVWKTDHSDTEVIIHAFEEWGIDCLHKLRGMFAMALWDENTRELWLVRDRIGIKPMYYSVHDGRLVYASEIKALLQDPDQRRAVNEEAFFHYLSFMTAPAPMTLFEGIHKIPPGTWMKFSEDGTIKQHRYYDVWDHTTPLTDTSEEDIAHMLLEELRTSVQLRKVSDVPVGVFLSGGIDSSANTALFSEGEHSPVKAFTVGYTQEYGSYRNEVDYARRMAEYVNADYHERLLSLDDLLNFMPRMIYLQDEPIADPVCMPLYYVSKLARDNGVTVCQVGEGADELFYGYPGWRRYLRMQEALDWPIPTAAQRLGLAGLALTGRRDTVRYEWLRRSIEGVPSFWGSVDIFTREQKERIISPRLRQKFAQFSSWEAISPTYQRFQEAAWEKSHINWMGYADLTMRLPELLLMRVDKMSMAVSLEGRVPFLDYKFVELALSIPSAMRTKNHTLKYILKKAVRGVIPDEFIDRPKQGFGVPVHEWFFDRLGADMRRELDAFCDQTDFLDRSEVHRLIEAQQSTHVWMLYNFALWWKQFIAPQPAGTQPAYAPVEVM